MIQTVAAFVGHVADNALNQVVADQFAPNSSDERRAVLALTAVLVCSGFQFQTQLSELI